MDDAGSEIREIVDRETRAWDTQDAELLLSVFHPDMVWPWPKSPSSHALMEWVLEWGRFDIHTTRSEGLSQMTLNSLCGPFRELVILVCRPGLQWHPEPAKGITEPPYRRTRNPPTRQPEQPLHRPSSRP
jgi:hypothetical protein